MKRKVDVNGSICASSPTKKRKTCAYDDDYKSEFPISYISNKKFQKNAAKTNKNYHKEVFCANEKRETLLSSLNKERKEKMNLSIYDIVIHEPKHYGNSEIVVANSLRTGNIFKIKETLKIIGFKWNAKHYEWTMKKQCFIADYDLYIGAMLKQICQTNKWTLSVFDFNYTRNKQRILTAAINIFIHYNPQINEIYIETNIDEEQLINLLDKNGYGLLGYGSNGINTYHKKGTLYNGHIETWREYVVFINNEWILGYIPDNIASTPNCINCDTKLKLHKVKKPGKNKDRRFYNCDQCYYHTKNRNKRKYSFIWADGANEKPSELFIDQQLTQPLSQMLI